MLCEVPGCGGGNRYCTRADLVRTRCGPVADPARTRSGAGRPRLAPGVDPVRIGREIGPGPGEEGAPQSSAQDRLQVRPQARPGIGLGIGPGSIRHQPQDRPGIGSEWIRNRSGNQRWNRPEFDQDSSGIRPWKPGAATPWITTWISMADLRVDLHGDRPGNMRGSVSAITGSLLRNPLGAPIRNPLRCPAGIGPVSSGKPLVADYRQKASGHIEFRGLAPEKGHTRGTRTYPIRRA